MKEIEQEIEKLCKELKGTEFYYVSGVGDHDAFLAEASLDKGLVIKDMENDNPDHFLNCIALMRRSIYEKILGIQGEYLSYSSPEDCPKDFLYDYILKMLYVLRSIKNGIVVSDDYHDETYSGRVEKCSYS